MSDLLAAYRPWAKQLSALVDDLAAELGPWVQSLDALLGPMRQASPAGDGEPDGYDGIARRGPYERLLVGEWAMAEAAPDEFLRRAAMGEHSFLELARVQEASGTRCVALFDIGPSQLGAVRLVHLALLAVLDRRAQNAGAPLVWGVLQAPEFSLKLSTPGSLRKLARSQHLCGVLGDLQTPAWEEARAQFFREGDEIFWIGGAEVMSREVWPEVRGRLVLEESVALLEEAISVRFVPRQGCAVACSLPMLPQDKALALLHGPRRSKKSKGTLHLVDTQSEFFFSQDGRRVLGRTVEGDAVAAHIPNSGADKQGHPRLLRMRDGERLLSFQWGWKRFLALTFYQGGFWLRGYHKGKNGDVSLARLDGLTHMGFALPQADGGLLPMQVTGGGGLPCVWLLDGARSLFRVVHKQGTGWEIVEVGRSVCSLGRAAPSSASFSFAVVCGESAESSDEGPEIEVRTWRATGDEVLASFVVYSLAFTVPSGRANPGYLLRTGAVDWSLVSSKNAVVWSVWKGSVVGVLEPSGNRPRLLVLGEDKHTFYGLQEGQPVHDSAILFKSSAPVVSARISLTREVLAVLTEGGQFGLYDFYERTWLGRKPGAEA